MSGSAPALGSVRLGACADGTLTYLVDLPPEALPPVLGRDLEAAWRAAPDAAQGGRWGAGRGVRFLREDGTYTDLAIADRDACCWAGAVDHAVGLHTGYGMSLCLRLLALVDLLAGASWARRLVELVPGGADLHPALLRAAATSPLTADARFDETGLRDRLRPFLGLALISGAPA